ncbi:MAG: phosphatidate cytidylyltransferase [Chloroflexota bacterium]
MFWQRFYVVVFGVPICYGIIWFGGWLFFFVILALLTLACFEYTRMAFGERCYPQFVALTVTVWLEIFADRFDLPPHGDFYTFLSLFSLLAFSLWGYERRNSTFPTNHLIKMSLGFLIIGWMGKYLLDLRSLDATGGAFLLIIFAIWAADVGAYVFGSLIGRTKLSPVISPNKSVEGYMAGIVSSCIVTPLFGYFLYPQYSIQTALLIALILSALVPLGDLGMSMLKRQAGVKDYGGIIPGHGGIMDRLDTILWGIVPGYYLIVMMAGL